MDIQGYILFYFILTGLFAVTSILVTGITLLVVSFDQWSGTHISHGRCQQRNNADITYYHSGPQWWGNYTTKKSEKRITNMFWKFFQVLDFTCIVIFLTVTYFLLGVGSCSAVSAILCYNIIVWGFSCSVLSWRDCRLGPWCQWPSAIYWTSPTERNNCEYICQILLSRYVQTSSHVWFCTFPIFEWVLGFVARTLKKIPTCACPILQK